MPRRRKRRRVEFLPRVTYFKPAGIPMHDLEEVILSIEELEAIRLKDLLGLDQTESADRMKISRPTFSRIIFSAHRKIAEILVKGKSLRVEGGNFRLSSWQKCEICNHSWEISEGDSKECPVCGNNNEEA